MENKKYYTAQKLQPRKGKEDSYWVIQFRHPLAKDNSGKPGKKIRKGLGTKDEKEAERLVDEMNILLSNESFWQPSSRFLAHEKYDIGIVNAFYDEIEKYKMPDYEKFRELKIPLKTKNDGYSRVLLLGSTGAGKTTLVSQLIGLNPKKEGVLAMSTSRTTVYDTEIVLSNSAFKCIVTFFTESETRQFINESIRNAIIDFFTLKDENHALRVFLEDKHQRFRLSQLIGKLSPNSQDDDDEDEDENIELFSSGTIVLNEEQKIIDEKIKGYINKIKDISNKIEERSNNGLNELSEEDKKALEELIISEIDEYDEEDIYSLEEDIISEIIDKFRDFDENELTREKSGWPIYWFHEEKIICPKCQAFIDYYKTNGSLKCMDCEFDSSVNNEVEELKTAKLRFLESIHIFSSNSGTHFGKLLTPLVSGMRVEGPFKPSFLNEIPKLIFIDGEGLGHNPNTSTNIPEKIITKFRECDAIMLVDNSQAPMLSGPSEVIKQAAVAGHYKKLFLCFTHFDLVKGPNLVKPEEKKNHILGSVDNQLDRLKTALGYDIKKYLSKHLKEYSYYLGFLDLDITNGSKKGFVNTKDEIDRLVKDLQTIIIAPDVLNITKPIYNISNLNFKIQAASMEFHNKWDGYLFGQSKEHFTRIKALARRLTSYETHYDSLFPIFNFYNSIVNNLSAFISTPETWIPTNATEKEKEDALNKIRDAFTSKIMDYSKSNLLYNKNNDWRIAYDFKGVGSASERAKKIKSIIADVSPIPGNYLNSEANKYLSDIIKITIDSIKENNIGDLKPLYGFNPMK